MAKNLSKNPGRALETGANVGTAFESRSLEAALSSLPEVIFLWHWKRVIPGQICGISAR